MEPEKLVKVWLEPMVLEIERLKHLSASTEVNPEMRKEYKAAFKEMWKEFIVPD